MENATIELEEVNEELFSVIPALANPGKVQVLDANTLTDKEFVKNWVSKNTPCLIKGAVKHWPAYKKWGSEDYWINHCDDFKIKVYPHQNFNDFERQKEGQEEMPYHSAVKRLFSKQDSIFSMPSEEIAEGKRFSNTLPDLGGFPFLKGEKKSLWYEKFRFFSYRRASTAWHVHGVDETLMCQVKGPKRVGLIAPDMSDPWYVSNFLNNEKYLDGKEFDEKVEVNTFMVDVEEGDALYIPPYWFHAVVPTDNEVGYTVAYCWRSPLHILGNFSNYFVRDLYKQGLRPIGPMTFVVPFLATAAGISYYTKKLFGNI